MSAEIHTRNLLAKSDLKHGTVQADKGAAMEQSNKKMLPELVRPYTATPPRNISMASPQRSTQASKTEERATLYNLATV